MEKLPMTVRQVADELKISSTTAWRWIKAGFLKSHQVFPRGKLFIRYEEVQRMKSMKGMATRGRK